MSALRRRIVNASFPRDTQPSAPPGGRRAAPPMVDPLEPRLMMAVVTATITGAVYNDLNANAHRDAGEPGLPGWVVYKDNNRNGVFDAADLSTVSDVAGNYALTYMRSTTSFTLPALFREVVQPGWKRTEPSLGVYPLGGTARNFGNCPAGPTAPAAAPPATSAAATAAGGKFSSAHPITYGTDAVLTREVDRANLGESAELLR